MIKIKNKNRKTVLALTTLALINIAIYPFFEGVDEAIIALIQGVLFSFPALIVDVWPRFLRKRAEPAGPGGERQGTSSAQVVSWAFAAYGLLTLIHGFVSYVDIDLLRSATEECAKSFSDKCMWLEKSRAAFEFIEHDIDIVTTLTVVVLASAVVIVMFTRWISNRSTRPLRHMVIGAATLSLLRALDVTMTLGLTTTRLPTASDVAVRFLLTWLMVFGICATIGLIVMWLSVRARSQLVFELRSARKNPTPDLPSRIRAAISMKFPGHDVRIRVRRSGFEVKEPRGSALRNWGMGLLSIAVAVGAAIAIAFATERNFTERVINEPDLSFIWFFLALSSCWPLYVCLRTWADSPQRRFERAWSRRASTAEALLLLIAAISMSAMISLSVVLYLSGHKAELIANCAADASLACHGAVLANPAGVHAHFKDYEISAGTTVEGGIFCLLLFLIGARLASQSRWIASALLILLPVILVSIARISANHESANSMTTTQLIVLAVGLRVVPFFLGVLVSKVARSYEMSRDHAVARELLSSRPFSRRVGDALLQSLGLDPAHCELAARRQSG